MLYTMFSHGLYVLFSMTVVEAARLVFAFAKGFFSNPFKKKGIKKRMAEGYKSFGITLENDVDHTINAANKVGDFAAGVFNTLYPRDAAQQKSAIENTIMLVVAGVAAGAVYVFTAFVNLKFRAV